MRQKTERIELRAPEGTKARWSAQAEAFNQNLSDYIRSLADNADILGSRHEALTSAYILIARLQNILNSYPELPEGLTESLTQEVLHHVNHQNGNRR